MSPWVLCNEERFIYINRIATCSRSLPSCSDASTIRDRDSNGTRGGFLRNRIADSDGIDFRCRYTWKFFSQFNLSEFAWKYWKELTWHTLFLDFFPGGDNWYFNKGNSIMIIFTLVKKKWDLSLRLIKLHRYFQIFFEIEKEWRYI